MNTIINECLRLKATGADSEEIVGFLHKKGLTISETIKVVMNIYGIHLGEAKKLVADNPAWQNVVKASEPLHDEVLRAFSEKQPSGEDVDQDAT